MEFFRRYKRRWLAVIAVALALTAGASIAYRIRTRTQPSGPYASLQGWQQISGRWNEHGGIFSNSNYGRGDMLIAPHSLGTDYHISADIRFDLLFPETHYGDAGLVIRTTDPEPGVDSYEGYYAGVRPDYQVILLGRASYDWRELATAHLVTPLSVGSWYHLDLSAHGCEIAFALSPVNGGPAARLKYNDKQCLTQGVAGLRSFYAQASWRNVQVSSN